MRTFDAWCRVQHAGRCGRVRRASLELGNRDGSVDGAVVRADVDLVAAFFGLAQGGIVPSYALIVRDYFPAREAATRVSLVLMMTVAGMAIGGWMTGEIQALAGSYEMAFLNGIIFNLINMSIAGWLLINRIRAQQRLV